MMSFKKTFIALICISFVSCQTTSNHNVNKIFKKSTLVIDTKLAKKLNAVYPVSSNWEHLFERSTQGKDNKLDKLIKEMIFQLKIEKLDGLDSKLSEYDELLDEENIKPKYKILRLYVEAEKYRLQSDFEKSIGFYKDAIRYDPTFVLAYKGLSSSYIQLNRYILAENVLDLGFESVENFSDLVLNYAELRKKQNRWQESKQWLDKSIELRPSSSEALASRASWYLKFKQPVLAQKDVIQSLKHDSRNVRSMLLSAMISINYNKNYDLAKKQLIRAMKYQPTNQRVKLKVAEILLEQNVNSEFVLKVLKNVVDSKNTSPRIASIANIYISTIKENPANDVSLF